MICIFSSFKPISYTSQDGAHSAGFHPDGNIIIIGTSGPRWLVIDIETRDVISTHTDGSEQIEVVQFSPGNVGHTYDPLLYPPQNVNIIKHLNINIFNIGLLFFSNWRHFLCP